MKRPYLLPLVLIPLLFITTGGLSVEPIVACWVLTIYGMFIGLMASI